MQSILKLKEGLDLFLTTTKKKKKMLNFYLVLEYKG